ncbi:hypothetical protein BB559_002238 [Furculomyces boomerangus]|uniref:Lysosomal dipeptide transporter MFSD1 n=2 Tax=Harpellales TaxID=61421 RepID=A0A2T9YX11_9FUNG|nr:hypothetical protein BB559_002238 [Furculomyces boomerangus]PVZ97819.1 hypothetical protein BB558_006213 [Smittium angustum]
MFNKFFSNSEKTNSHEVSEDNTTTKKSSKTSRYIVLVICCLLSFGSHFSGTSLGSLKNILKKELKISNTQYGILQASNELLNTFMPLVSGIVFDIYGSVWGSLVVSTAIFLGTLIVAISASISSFPLMVVGRLIYGAGSGAIVGIQESILAQWFSEGSLSTVIGVQLSTSRLSTYIGTITVVPFGEATNWYGNSFYLSAGLCGFCLLLNVVYSLMITKQNKLVSRSNSAVTINKKKFEWRQLLRLPLVFWILMFSQMALGSSWSSFLGFNAEMIKIRFKTTDTIAAYKASVSQVVPIILPFVLGIFLDRIGQRLHFYLGSSLLGLLSYILLGFTNAHPMVAMTIFSFSLASGPISNITVLPTILPIKYIGTALGLKKVLTNVGTVILDLLSGYVQDHSKKKDYKNVMVLFVAISIVSSLLIVWMIGIDYTRFDGAMNAPRKRRLEHMKKKNQKENIESVDKMQQEDKKPNVISILSISIIVATFVAAWTLFIVFYGIYN